MKRVLFLSLLAVLVFCLVYLVCSREVIIYPPLSGLNNSSNSPQNSRPIPPDPAESLYYVKNVKWVDDTCTGVLLGDSVAFFHADHSFYQFMNFENPVEVKILQRSDTMMFRNAWQEYCSKLYYLVIDYKGEKFIVRGDHIYKKNEKPLFEFTWKDQPCTIETASFLRMGAADSTGLTFCPEGEYRLTYVKNSVSGRLHLFNVDLYGQQEGIVTEEESYYVLFDNDGWYDDLKSAEVHGDTLQFYVQRSYQEGGEEMFIDVFERDGEFDLYIEKSTRYHFRAPWDEPL